MYRNNAVKRTGRGAIIVGMFFVLFGCATSTLETPKSILRRPDLLDHKNLKFGREIPQWVLRSQMEIEDENTYPQRYVFKFESPRSQNLQAAELWTRNFSAAERISQLISTRVEAKFVGAVEGDLNRLQNYLEQVTKTISNTTVSGYKVEADYWIQNRYYNINGEIDENAYTFFALYTISKSSVDRLIRSALEDATEKTALTPAQERARERVSESFSDGL